MLQSITQGVLLGLLLSVLIGPVFFLLLKISIERGARAAAILDIGVIISDIFVIFCAYLGLASLMQNIFYQKIMGVVGGIILILFGLTALLKKKKVTGKEIVLKSSRLMLEGALINLTNPFVWLFWIAAVGVAVSQFGHKKIYVVNYFVSCIITCIAIDVVKIYLARILKRYLNTQRLSMVDKIANSAVVIFGIVLIIRVLKL